VADALLEPTVIYVRAIVELVRSGLPVHGLAHITGGGLLNLLRIGSGVGYEISSPLPIPPVFELIAAQGHVAPAEMWEVFNMGCGFCAMAPADRADEVVALLGAHHPGTAVIGRVTSDAGIVRLPGLGLIGDSSGLRPG
jgi:phosphoribosylformylglycinamidine cyclo-ligase